MNVEFLKSGQVTWTSRGGKREKRARIVAGTILDLRVEDQGDDWELWDGNYSILMPKDSVTIGMTYGEFAALHKITLTWTEADANPNMPGDDMDHYKVTLRCDGRKMTLPFSKGIAHRGDPPTVDEILSCLASDSHFSDDSFEEFCSELGYDTDRSALRNYKQVVKQTERARHVLGDCFDALLAVKGD